MQKLGKEEINELFGKINESLKERNTVLRSAAEKRIEKPELVITKLNKNNKNKGK